MDYKTKKETDIKIIYSPKEDKKSKGSRNWQDIIDYELIKRAYPKNSIYDSYLLVYERIIDLNDARVY